MFKKVLVKFFKYIRFCLDGGYTNLSIATIQYPQILKGKKIIITGGSEGIGFCIAQKFIAAGASVVITGRNLDKLKKAKELINSENLYISNWDVTDFDNLQSNIERTICLLQGVDILVNNAGLVSFPIEVSENDYDRIMNTNMKAVYFISKSIIEYFKKNNKERGGKIINISSFNALQPSSQPYYLSKSALLTYSKGLAKDNAKYNIIVNSILPGVVAVGHNYQDVSKNAYDDKSLNHRVVIPEEIAEVAMFLASDVANGIIGQAIIIDGGRTLV